MDLFDAKLLKLVQHNNRLTADQLAQAVGLSPSACQRRLRRLRETGAIVADISVLAPNVIGRRLTAIMRVSLDTARPDIVDRFKRSALQRPEVMQCYNTAGEADFVLVVTARDMPEFEEISHQFYTENPHIRKLTTNMVIDRVKVGLAVPVDEEDRAA